MRPDEAGWQILQTRRHAPHHLQVRVSAFRDWADEDSPFRQMVIAEVCHVFRTRDERPLRAGESISFEVTYAVPRDTPSSEQPIGPIFGWLEDLASARFLEVFLERNLVVPNHQVRSIAEPTPVAQMTLDDPELARRAAMWESFLRERHESSRTYARQKAFVARAVREHAADDFAPFDIAVFQFGDTYVARLMLPHEHPNDLGSLRRFVKSERRAGRVSAADERICCTRGAVMQRIMHERGAAYFLA